MIYVDIDDFNKFADLLAKTAQKRLNDLAFAAYQRNYPAPKIPVASFEEIKEFFAKSLAESNDPEVHTKFLLQNISNQGEIGRETLLESFLIEDYHTPSGASANASASIEEDVNLCIQKALDVYIRHVSSLGRLSFAVFHDKAFKNHASYFFEKNKKAGYDFCLNHLTNTILSETDENVLSNMNRLFQGIDVFLSVSQDTLPNLFLKEALGEFLQKPEKIQKEIEESFNRLTEPLRKQEVVDEIDVSSILSLSKDGLKSKIDKSKTGVEIYAKEMAEDFKNILSTLPLPGFFSKEDVLAEVLVNFVSPKEAMSIDDRKKYVTDKKDRLGEILWDVYQGIKNTPPKDDLWSIYLLQNIRDRLDLNYVSSEHVTEGNLFSLPYITLNSEQTPTESTKKTPDITFSIKSPKKIL